MSDVTETALSLTVDVVDPEHNLILIRGAVPGPKGSLVLLRTAAKNKLAKGGVAK